MILILLVLLVWLASIDPPWSVVIIVVACGLEVVEIALLRRWAGRLDRRTKRTTGPEAMIGKWAEVVEPCRPEGTVRLDGELWQARCEAGADPGETVRVDAVDGLSVVVSPRVERASRSLGERASR